MEAIVQWGYPMCPHSPRCSASDFDVLALEALGESEHPVYGTFRWPGLLERVEHNHEAVTSFDRWTALSPAGELWLQMNIPPCAKLLPELVPRGV